jgi:sugar lactone lactonase YvrE
VLGTANVAAFNPANFTTVSNANNPSCNGRTITVTNTLVNDTLVWSDFASRPTLSNFGNLGNVSFANGVAELTPATNSQNGKLVFPSSPNAGVFTANFKMRIWDGGGADGMSFNYGIIDNINGGVGGMCNTMGLSISMPTWSGNGGQRLIIKYKGVQIGSTINSVALRNSNYIPVNVTVDASFRLTVSINGIVYLNNYDLFANTTYASDSKTNWQFAFGAETGGSNDAHRIDDVIITGKPGLLYSYNGGTTFETNASKIIAGTNAVTVVVKADGSCNSSTVSFPAITITTPTFTQVAPICAGATLASLPTTSLNGIVGIWSPSINNLATTTYTFTPSSSCNPTTTMTIVVNPLPSITSVSATPSAICVGDSSTLQVTAPLAGTFVSTLAGSGAIGSADGIGTLASFKSPNGVAIDNANNVYVADYLNNKIRKITPAGVVTTFAGSNIGGSADGIGTAASFVQPTGVAIDISGNVFIVDQGNHKIRKATPSGVVTTFAGSGTPGFSNGSGATAMFDVPSGIAVDNAGNVYVADQYNNMIRKITAAGVVSTLAGTGAYGSTDGPGTLASFNFPTGVAIDNAGNVYVADKVSNKIRKITAAGFVSTLAGTGLVGSVDGVGTSASFYYPSGVAVDNVGNVYVADQYNKKIRKITAAGIVSTLAGTGLQGSADGASALASFNYPPGVALDNAGNVYVADQQNNKIRKITQTLPQTYTWSGTVNSLSAALDTVSAMPTSTTIYTVTASNASGCTTTSTVTVTVKPNYSITASTGANGNISPAGNSAVCEGSNLTYTITPNVNYQIADVFVDGISVGALTSYTFTNVTAPHTISASFVLNCATTFGTINQSICIGSSYTFNGIARTTAGAYLDTLVNAGGCDSILTLNLTVTPLTSSSATATACYTYTWSVNNVTYSTSGIYVSTTGCHTDSLILSIEACKDVKCLIQGHYVSVGTMLPVLSNEGISAPSNYCDTLEVALHSATAPYAQVHIFNGILGTNGMISCTFPESAIGNNYYIVLTYRNALQTWSKNPVAITNTAVYDFSTNANKAYGDNQVQVSTTEWALYSGDVNHDGSIDAFDYILLDSDLILGAFGYLDTDIIGDGTVDSYDYLLLDANLQLGASSVTP